MSEVKPPEWARYVVFCPCGNEPAYSSAPFSTNDGCGAGDQPGIKMYIPKPRPKEWRLLDRRKPFELFLKFGGGIFDVHLQIHRLVVMIEPKRSKK